MRPFFVSHNGVPLQDAKTPPPATQVKPPTLDEVAAAEAHKASNVGVKRSAE